MQAALQPHPASLHLFRPTTFTVNNSTRRMMTRDRFRPDPSDSIIVIMGPTGSGKSNFINTVTGNVEQSKAGKLTSDTQHVIPYRFANQDVRVVLVDTPGFDDTYRSDNEILRVIADWLTQKYPGGDTLNVSGIIYFHRITDNRMSGSVYKNLQMFGRLCGNLPLPRVRLVTTMWDIVKDIEIANNREKQLKDEFWKQLIEEGAIARQFDNKPDSALAIVRELTMLKKGDDLLLQEELVEQHKHLNETEAAKILYSRAQQLLLEQKKMLKELADEARLQDDPVLASRLQEEYDKINAQLQRTFDEINVMKIPFLRRLILRWFGPKSRSHIVKLDDPPAE